MSPETPHETEFPRPPDERRCTATSKGTGERCGQWTAGLGITVCHYHGGGAPQVKAAAMKRILEMVDPALYRLRKLIDEGNTDDVRLRAARDVLDRAGLGEQQSGEQRPLVAITAVIMQILAPYPDLRLQVAQKLFEAGEVKQPINGLAHPDRDSS